MLLALLVWYAVLSAVTLGAFALDKVNAKLGRWRVRERTLHGLTLAGGVAGAWAGMLVIRHKTRHAAFWVVAGVATVVHVVVLLVVAVRWARGGG